MADDVKYRTEDASNNNLATAKKAQLFSKKPSVDLSFENLTYTVQTFNEFKRGEFKPTHPFPSPTLGAPFSCRAAGSLVLLVGILDAVSRIFFYSFSYSSCIAILNNSNM